MTGQAQAILSQALELDPEDRGELVDALTESLETWAGDEVEAAWRLEVAERVASLKAKRLGTRPWSAVRAQLVSRLP